MQAHPAQAHLSPTGPTGTPGSVTGALRAMEAFLLRGGQQTARRNAWTAVLEDRRRAKDRNDAQHVLETLGAGHPVLGAAAGAPLAAVRAPGGAEH